MKAKCKKCGDTVEVTRLREYKICKCGAIGLDYGDGENYCRVCGDPEDFDGAIEGVTLPPIQEPRPREPRASTLQQAESRPIDTDLNVNDISPCLDSLSTALSESADLVKKIAKLINESTKRINERSKK